MYKVIEWEFYFLYLVHANNILLVSSDVNSTAGGKEVLVLKVQNCISRSVSRYKYRDSPRK